MADLNSRVRVVLAAAKAGKATAIQIARVVGNRTEESIAARPYEARDDFADRLCEIIADELDDLSGPHSFIVRAVAEGGVELARERVRMTGNKAAPPQVSIVRGRNGSVDAEHSAPGVGAATDDLVLPDGALTGSASTAVLVSLLRQQYRHNEGLFNLVTGLAKAATDPLVKQTEVLGSAWATATHKLTESAAAHVDLIRQTRILESEARSEERRSEAIAAAGRALAAYLPTFLGKLASRLGLSDGAAGVDPVFAELVLSVTPEQLGSLQTIFTEKQIAAFADVWAKLDEQREAEKKKRGTKPEAKPANGAT